MAKTKDEKEEQKQQRIENHIATPEEVEELRAKYLEAMAAGPPKIIAKGFDFTLEPLACTLEGDEVRIAVKPAGQMIRDGMVYVVTGELAQLVLSDDGTSELVVKVKVKKSHAIG